MNDPRLDQVITMLNTIGAEMGIDFSTPEPIAEEMPAEGMDEEMPDHAKEKYLSMKPEQREVADKKKVFGRK